MKSYLEMPVPSQGHYCLYNYEFWLSLCKIVRSSVILLLPLFKEMQSKQNELLTKLIEKLA